MTPWDDGSFDPARDLTLDRTVGAPPERVWGAWTVPDQLARWFAPAPWTVGACEIDLRPGGAFRMVMRSPEGDGEVVTDACYLEVVDGERLVWTTALSSGFRPADAPPRPVFTAAVTLRAAGTGTRYSTRVMHGGPADRERHAEFGFEAGWARSHDQLGEFLA